MKFLVFFSVFIFASCDVSPVGSRGAAKKEAVQPQKEAPSNSFGVIKTRLFRNTRVCKGTCESKVTKDRYLFLLFEDEKFYKNSKGEVFIRLNYTNPVAGDQYIHLFVDGRKVVSSTDVFKDAKKVAPVSKADVLSEIFQKIEKVEREEEHHYLLQVLSEEEKANFLNSREYISYLAKKSFKKSEMGYHEIKDDRLIDTIKRFLKNKKNQKTARGLYYINLDNFVILHKKKGVFSSAEYLYAPGEVVKNNLLGFVILHDDKATELHFKRTLAPLTGLEVEYIKDAKRGCQGLSEPEDFIDKVRVRGVLIATGESCPLPDYSSKVPAVYRLSLEAFADNLFLRVYRHQDVYITDFRGFPISAFHSTDSLSKEEMLELGFKNNGKKINILGLPFQ
jgi:hypothetical protein